MRIGLRKYCFWILFLLSSVTLYAQQQDTAFIEKFPFERYWTKQRFIPKIGVGTQDRAFVEVGLQWHNIYKHPLTLGSKGPYATVDLFIDDSNWLVGPKLGYEVTAGVFGVALDFTYYFDNNYDGEGSDRNSFVATPKVGLTILGFADFFYGYQIPLSDQEITTIYRNRFSLVFNLNRDYFDMEDAPRKR